ncbi:protein of unknown function [Cupriavidus taiwanensis]|uniref:Uncharacterized protein n=1 Tax=Cupriavidus taiwanensis TaxID=164546 RepID=A0A375I9Q9_9BURK|nr:hypothetical protein [Cupriavidus taiwanensis]SPK70239.1 hypothetical protein CT19425_U440014 [Cupriavidus taiwanensis]SPK72277.1 protein of unknown function [Cupriavidus taiwanensis]
MNPLIISASVAPGIGLAIGLERERSQAADRGSDAPAGLNLVRMVRYHLPASPEGPGAQLGR